MTLFFVSLRDVEGFTRGVTISNDLRLILIIFPCIIIGLALISVGFAFSKIFASFVGAFIILIAVILLPLLRVEDENGKKRP